MVKDALATALSENGEKWSDIVSSTLTEAELNRPYSCDCEDFPSFTVWTEGRVYFPATYDSSGWIDSVSRHPDGIPTKPIGKG